MPKRIQRKRTKGWRLPKKAMCVTRPGPFGNPFETSEDFENVLRAIVQTTHGSVEIGCGIADFGHMMNIAENLKNLRGKDLACWCKPGKPCHADVLIELSNR